MINNNENIDMCSKCGGRCCKRYAGFYKYSELSKDYKNRLGKDLVVAVDILLNPIVIQDTLPPVVTPDILSRIQEDIETWNRVFPDSQKVIEFAYCVKPKQCNDKHPVVLSQSFRNEGYCVFLGKDGCSLSFDERPFLCKALEPNFIDGTDACKNNVKFSKAVVLKSWKREYSYLEEYVLGYILDNRGELEEDPIYLQNLILPYIENNKI